MIVRLLTALHFLRVICSLYKIREEHHFPLSCLCKNKPDLSTVASLVTKNKGSLICPYLFFSLSLARSLCRMEACAMPTSSWRDGAGFAAWESHNEL